jgi:hypothetical protein
MEDVETAGCKWMPVSDEHIAQIGCLCCVVVILVVIIVVVVFVFW